MKRKERVIQAVVSLLFFIGGFTVVYIYQGWETALALFFILWAGNIDNNLIIKKMKG